MLVLTRKIGEEIILDGRIRISVQKIRGKRVTVAIDAPDEVSVIRGELAFDHSPTCQRASDDAVATLTASTSHDALAQCV